MRTYSDRFFLKYLLSDRGVCLGVELRDRSYLLIASRRGITFRRRPSGDRVVEHQGYDIPRILQALEENLARVRSSRGTQDSPGRP